MENDKKLFDIVQTGDLLFVSGNTWISRAIKAFTFGRTNHVGVVYDRSNIFETDIRWGKAEFHPLSNYDGQHIMVLRYKPLSNHERIMKLCHKYKGIPYSWLDIVNNAIFSVLSDGIRSKLVGWLGNEKHEICSELSAHILYEAEKIKELASFEGLTPQDLLKICLFNPDRWQIVYQHSNF